MATIEGPGQVGVNNLSPLLRCDLADIGKQPYAGVVNENIDPAKTLDREFHQFANVFHVAYIAGRTSNAVFGHLVQLLNTAVYVFAGARTNHDSGTFIQQLSRNGSANPLCPAGYDCHFVVE
jgi:hypothetical protein